MRPCRSILQLTVLFAVAGCATPTSSHAQELWGDLPPGAHDAGFKRVWHLDHTRVWPRSAFLDSLQGEVARPMRIDVWFPADCERGSRMVLGDFVRMESPAPAFDDLVFLTHQWDDYSYRGLVSDSTEFEAFLETELSSCAGGEPAEGRFPLVVYSSGWFNRTPDNFVLAEFLASHGYVVVGIPQLNPGLWTFSFASDAASVEAQTRDLETALGVMIRDDMVDRRRVAAMGYSTGGDVALLLQGRNALVDVVVGLDPSWALGPDNDVGGSPFFSADLHTVPTLVLRRPIDDGRAADLVLDSLVSAPRIVVEIPDAGHGSFADDVPLRTFLGIGTAAEGPTHGVMARAVLAFFDAAMPAGSTPIDMRRVAAELESHGLAARLLPAVESGDD